VPSVLLNRESRRSLGFPRTRIFGAFRRALSVRSRAFLKSTLTSKKPTPSAKQLGTPFPGFTITALAGLQRFARNSGRIGPPKARSTPCPRNLSLFPRARFIRRVRLDHTPPCSTGPYPAQLSLQTMASPLPARRPAGPVPLGRPGPGPVALTFLLTWACFLYSPSASAPPAVFQPRSACFDPRVFHEVPGSLGLKAICGRVSLFPCPARPAGSRSPYLA